jgi:DNA-binding CsgD family transcriptional regulator
MPQFSDYEVIHMGGRGITPSALTADQRKLAYRVRRLSNTPWEELTPSEKRLMRRVADEHVTPNQIAKYTDISESELRSAIHMQRYKGIDPNSLVFKASRGFYGKANYTDAIVILYGRESEEEGSYITFDTPQSIEHVISEKMPCPTPPCDEEEYVKTWIPMKNGVERSNLTSSREISAA